VELGTAFIAGPSLEQAMRHAAQVWRGQRGFFYFFADSYKVDGALVSGQYVVGTVVWLREKEAARLVLQHRERPMFLVVTFVKSEKLSVEGEVCVDVQKLDGGECRLLSYRAYCRYCHTAHGKTRERCWIEVEVDGEEVAEELERLGLRNRYGVYESEPMDRDRLMGLVKTVKSICGG